MADLENELFSESSKERLEETVNLSRRLVESTRELLKLNKEIDTETYKTFNSNAAKLSKNLDEILIKYSGFEKLEIKKNTALKLQQTIQKQLTGLEKEKITLEGNSLKAAQDTFDSLEKQYKLSTERYKKDEARFGFYSKRTKISRDQLSLDEKARNIAKERLDSQKFAIDQAGKVIELAKIESNELELYIKNWDKASNRLGIASGILKGISKIPVAGDVFKANDALFVMQRSLIKGDSLFRSLSKGIKVGFEDISKPLIVLTALTKLFKAGLQADEQTTKLAKSLSISKEQASGIRQEFAAYARTNESSFITTNKLLEAQNSLTEELGVAAQFTGKQAEDYTRLTKLIGISNKAAADITRLGLINNKSTEATTKAILKGAFASQVQYNVALNNKDILEDISKLSAGILVKFQQNPEALGKAVAQAKALGLTLDQVDKIGESLLNWESSIENELRAELLTGRELNLERARAAALTGDQAALTKEIASQVGTLNDFQKLNVLAQNSLAQAFGLSRDELAQTLLDQEKFKKLGDTSNKTLQQQFELLKASGEPIDSVLYKQLQQQSAQEKFNNTVEKLQDIIGNLVAGPIGKLLDAFSNLLSNTTLIKGVLEGLAAVSFVKLLTSLGSMAVELGIISAESIATNAALTFGLGAAAAVAGAAVMSSMLDDSIDKAKNQAVKDGIAPANKGPFTITDRYGATAITTQGDGIAVSPNINKASSNDNSAILERLDKLIAVNESHKSVTQQGRVHVWNDQIIARENVRSNTMNNPIYFS